ncbi:hypothetical protein RQL81_14640 [Citrobacter braakii]|nr:hypothetical protein [Citrobacter braakii]
MKPDVKKIIADIKATKGNRKFCNGLAGTLQDDNYASSICKYVKTVTPERIDLLIEYAEKLEAEVTDMSVQLVNAESKCMSLAAENAGLKSAIAIAEPWLPTCDEELAHRIEQAKQTPATDAFLAEVRAQGVEMMAAEADQLMNEFGDDSYKVMVTADLQRFANAFAAQIRKGAAL